MADYAALKQTIDTNVNTNGQQAITGAILNDVLNEMVDVLGEGYTFLGVATPTTNPTTPEGKAYYLAGAAGTYTNFGSIVVADNEVVLLVWNGTAWTKVVTPATTANQVSQLSQEVDRLVQEQSVADMSIADSDGNILVDFKGGHIKTKNFDSESLDSELSEIREEIASKPVSETTLADGDFFISDEDGNAIVEFSDGHIKTKNFDSANLQPNEDQLEIPTGEFAFDTALLPMQTELAGFDPSAKDSIGCETFSSQIISKIDALVTENSAMLEKLDAASFAGLDYPTYANLNGSASGNYLATPSYTIPLYHFKDTSARNTMQRQKIFIVAGIHGWENASQFNTFVLLSKLCNCASPDYMALRSAIDLYVIPCVNRYGAFHATDPRTISRKNANGVDINRNFPNPTWQVMGEPTDTHYSGPYAASEFETQMIIKCAEKIIPDVMIDHHSYNGNDTYNFYQAFSNLRGQKLGYQNIYAWTARGCLSLPTYYGMKGILHPNDFLVDRGQTCTGWSYWVGIADGITNEVSIGINSDTTTRWTEENVQMNELSLRLTMMKYVHYQGLLSITTKALNEDMLI